MPTPPPRAHTGCRRCWSLALVLTPATGGRLWGWKEAWFSRGHGLKGTWLGGQPLPMPHSPAVLATLSRDSHLGDTRPENRRPRACTSPQQQPASPLPQHLGEQLSEGGSASPAASWPLWKLTSPVTHFFFLQVILRMRCVPMPATGGDTHGTSVQQQLEMAPAASLIIHLLSAVRTSQAGGWVWCPAVGAWLGHAATETRRLVLEASGPACLVPRQIMIQTRPLAMGEGSSWWSWGVGIWLDDGAEGKTLGRSALGARNPTETPGEDCWPPGLLYFKAFLCRALHRPEPG